MSEKILIIDDDVDLGKLLEAMLVPVGMIVFHAYSGNEGIRKAYELHPDLIILDVMMPGLNGFEVCERLREMANFPILMLTARGNPTDLLQGFNVGADDYLKKPFNKDELIARVRALLRRSRREKGADITNITHYADKTLSIDLENQMVQLGEKAVELSPTEYKLLAYLVRNMRRIVPQRELLNEVWGSAYGISATTLTLYIFYLRKKLQDAKHGHQYIHTQRGRGYWFLPRKKE